jgi:ribosomal protein S18 acetylase RimI-like enzyme
MTIENGAEKSVVIRPAVREDVAALLDLLYLRPPCSWMSGLSTASLAVFLRYAIDDSRVALMLARFAGDGAPAAYIFAIADPGPFWLRFAVEYPVIAQAIWFLRRRRAAERRRELARAGFDGAAASPEFSWAPAYRNDARILGVYVRPDRRESGLARKLYLALFARLKAGGTSAVEEHWGPDYRGSAGEYPSGLGWRLEACGCGGRKASRSL